MNYYLISAILNTTTSILVSLFILLNNPRSAKNRSFAYFGFSVFLWAFFYNFWINATDKESALFYMRLSIGLAIFIPATFSHFAINLIEEFNRYKRTLLLLYIYSFIIFLTSPFKLFIYDAKPLLIFHFWPLAGITYNFHVLNYFVTPLFGLLIIYKKIKISSLQEARQLKLVLWGIFFSYLGGATNFPLNYSIPFPPIGNIFASLYTVFIAYAAFRYQLMNVNIIIKKSLLYTLLITTITLFYFLSTYLIENIFQSMFGYKSLLISIISATFIALLFIPLRDFIQNFIEKTLFKGSYIEIAEENAKLREEIIHTEKMRAVAMIASGLAHEIKNPITAIQTFTEYLPQKRNDNEFIDQYTRIVSQEAKRINDLIQELLAFSKPSEPKLEEIDPKILIKNIIKLLSPQITKSNIQTHINLSDSPSHIQVDPAQLKQALLNIIMNAIDAMPNGGTLSITSSLSFSNDPVGNLKHYIIKISDTGSGISPKDLPHIFEPFFTKKEKGTGLGLAITQGIIEKHGGKIIVKSKINSGTIFILQLSFKE